MKAVKQTGKALCYALLFLGMQAIAMFLFTVVCSAGLTMQLITENGGAVPDGVELAEKVMESVLANTIQILLISNGLVMLFLLIFFAIRRKNMLTEVQAKKFAAGFVPHIVLLAAAFALAVCILLGFLPEEMMESYSSMAQYIVSDSLLLSILCTVIVGPITEEVIFRGLVYSRLKKAMPTAIAVVLTSLIFGLMHGQSVWIAYAFVLGLVMNFLVIKTGSILSSILFHILFNLLGSELIPNFLPETWNDGVYVVIAVAAVVVSLVELVVILRKRENG